MVKKKKKTKSSTTTIIIKKNYKLDNNYNFISSNSQKINSSYETYWSISKHLAATIPIFRRVAMRLTQIGCIWVFYEIHVFKK